MSKTQATRSMLLHFVRKENIIWNLWEKSAATTRIESGAGEQSGGAGEQSGGAGEQSGGAGEQSGGAGEQSGGAGEQSGGAGEQSGGAGEQSGGAGEQSGGAGEQSGGAGEQSGGAGEQSGAGERAERDERGEKTKTKLPSVTIDVNKYVLKFVLQLSVILFHIYPLIFTPTAGVPPTLSPRC